MGNLEELRQLHESLRLAIEKITQGAQEYRIGSRTVRRADLGQLWAQYQQVGAQIDRATVSQTGAPRLGRRRWP